MADYRHSCPYAASWGYQCWSRKPSLGLVFLGITLDSIRMEARLPQDTLQKCLHLVRSYRQLQKISIKKLKSLKGLLNLTCNVVRLGKPFLCLLYNLMEGMIHRLPFLKIRLNAGAKEDLRRWELFLQDYNGVTMFLPPTTLTHSDMSIQLASEDYGWTLVRSAKWVKSQWGPIFQGSKSTLVRGMVLFVRLIHVFGRMLTNSRIQLECMDVEVAHVNVRLTKTPRLCKLCDNGSCLFSLSIYILLSLLLTSCKKILFYNAR